LVYFRAPIADLRNFRIISSIAELDPRMVWPEERGTFNKSSTVTSNPPGQRRRARISENIARHRRSAKDACFWHERINRQKPTDHGGLKIRDSDLANDY